MRRGHGVRLGDSYKRLWGAAKRGMREEWATAHIISQMWRHTAHTHTHTPVWKLSCRQVSSSRSGLVSQAPGFFFSSVFPSSSSFFVLFFCFKRFRYIYILGILLFIFFQRKVYTGKNKGNCFFFFFFFSIPTAHQFIKVSPHPACAHTHTTHAPVCFQLMPRPSRFHNHLSFSFFLSWFFILCGENHTRRLSVSINRLFSIRKSKIEREKGKQVYNDRNQWRRATFFFMIRRAADWLTGLFWNCFTTRMYNVGGKVKF